MVPTAKNSAPIPMSHGNIVGAPVEAKDAVVDADAAPVLPVFPVDEPPDVVVAVATGVVPVGEVVVVVVVAVVVVVVEVTAAAVNVTFTVRAVRLIPSVVSSAV